MATFLGYLKRLLVCVIRCGFVARLLDAEQDVGQGHAAAVPCHPRPQGAVVHFGANYAIESQKLLLNQPHTRRASDAAYHQNGFAFVFAGGFDEVVLHIGQVVQFQLRQNVFGRQGGFLCLCGAAVVIAAQARADDALGNGLATRAAGAMALVFKFDGAIDVVGNGQAAMETVLCWCIHVADYSLKSGGFGVGDVAVAQMQWGLSGVLMVQIKQASGYLKTGDDVCYVAFR